MLYNFDKAFFSCFDCADDCKQDLDNIESLFSTSCSYANADEFESNIAHVFLNMLWRQFTSCQIKGKLYSTLY